jgi:hypothetical protein
LLKAILRTIKTCPGKHTVFLYCVWGSGCLIKVTRS